MARFRSNIFVFIVVLLVLGWAGLAAAQAPTQVTFWAWNPAGYENLDDGTPGPAQAAFEAAHPEIDLVVEAYSYPDYLSQLQLNMASGTGPDLVALQAGALLNTYDEFLVDLAPLAEAEWGADWRERFFALGLDQTTSEDGVFGLPLMNSAA